MYPAFRETPQFLKRNVALMRFNEIYKSIARLLLRMSLKALFINYA